jgi:hypothetical protein
MAIAPEWLVRDDPGGGCAMKIRPGAVVRGAGVALACLAPDPSKRSPVLIAGFAVGWFLNKPGLRVFTVIPDTDEPWKRTTVPFATSVTAWSTLMLAATTAVRATRLPAPIAAVLLGGGLIVVDSVLTDLGEAREAAEAAEAAAASAPAGQ